MERVMKSMITTTLVAAAAIGLASAAQAQVPTAQSQYNGVTPRPAIEGRVMSTNRADAVTPDNFARGTRTGRVHARHAYVHHGYARYPYAGRPVEGRVMSTTRMNVATPDELAWRRGPAYGAAPMMAYPEDDEVETSTIVTSPPSALVVAPGPSQEWKWSQCAKLYPSFNPATGTFTGEDGLMHLCQ
jgi:hypothetical protein